MADAGPGAVLDAAQKFVARVRRELKPQSVVIDVSSHAKRMHVVKQRWDRRQQCMAHPCTTKTIKHSHVIQEAALELLARQKGLVTPRWQKAQIEVDRVSLETATTFPGYCERHEGLFDWEKDVLITTDRHKRLQLMRSAHWEAWALAKGIEMNSAYQGLLRDLAARSRGCHLSGEASVRPRQRDAALSGQRMARHLARVEAVIADLGPAEGEVTSRAAILEEVVGRLPVAMSASVMMGPDDDSSDGWALVVALLPNGPGSLLLLATDREHEQQLEDYRARYVQDVTRWVELWLLDGTLDWYGSCVWWSGLATEVQDEASARVRGTRVRGDGQSPVGLLEAGTGSGGPA